ncbi:MAG: LacI family DNA-binding transcriptional regulator [Opitutaceae bacterium]
MDRRVSLKDVAQAAGVHPTTVSMALRNHPRIPEKTRERLKKLAEKMGYTRDPALVALVEYRNSLYRSKSPPVIAFLTDWKPADGWRSNPTKNMFWTGAHDRAHRLGYKLEHFSLGEAGMTAARMSKILLTRNIKGLILANFLVHTESIELPWDHLCAVKIDYEPLAPRLASITNNQLQITRLAMQRIRALGYRRIGLCLPDSWEQMLDDVWAIAYLWEQQKHEPEDRIPELRYAGAEDIRSKSRAFKQWFDQYKPDAVLGDSAEIIAMAESFGIRIPRDLAVADFNCMGTDGAIAGITQNHLDVGRLAVDMVAGFMSQHIFGLPAVPVRSFVDGYWTDGRSCPPVKAKKATRKAGAG